MIFIQKERFSLIEMMLRKNENPESRIVKEFQRAMNLQANKKKIRIPRNKSNSSNTL